MYNDNIMTVKGSLSGYSKFSISKEELLRISVDQQKEAASKAASAEWLKPKEKEFTERFVASLAKKQATAKSLEAQTQAVAEQLTR